MASLYKSLNRMVCQSSSLNFKLGSIFPIWIGSRRMQSSFVRKDQPFDIFMNSNLYSGKFDKPDVECAKKAALPQYLRPGMMLLKNFLSHTDQVKIVNKCRDLGIGCGGFYRPEYDGGAKSRRLLMCLGKDWDYQSQVYRDKRRFDGAVPPELPEEFRSPVDSALGAAHRFLKAWNSEKEIPSMSPDICLINFYEHNGKLGLHQDKTESMESLKKGIPVVTLSVGDSAEFLYSDTRDDYMADKVILESGDALIFGGKSRLLYHGVSRILPNTAPRFLALETNFRPGRLSLTFRQF